MKRKAGEKPREIGQQDRDRSKKMRRAEDLYAEKGVKEKED